MKLSALIEAYGRLPRHTRFAIEVVLSLFIAVFGGFLAAKTGGKLNAKANGDIRAAAAQERIAEALERAYPAPAPDPECFAISTRADGTSYCAEPMPLPIIFPPPTRLHTADLKAIPNPDPDPCENTVANAFGARYRLRPSGYPEPTSCAPQNLQAILHLTTLGGTARDVDCRDERGVPQACP